MYVSQQKWGEKNWKDALKIHARRDIEDLLEKINVFDLWGDMLIQKHTVAKYLIPEIFTDSYLSIHFACMGLYKQANVCLRAQLETALRLVYFSTHPVEFGWWFTGKDDFFKKKDVWSEDFYYFRRLVEIEEFQQKCKENGDAINVFSEVGQLYSKLSRYVHSSVSSFQTSPQRFTPKYKKAEFGKWLKCFKETQKYICLVLILGFANDFKTASLPVKKRILKVTEENKIKKGLRQLLGLKFRGRV
jgi:hypothetical protein